MGESKRRKNLDVNYGKPQKTNIRINDEYFVFTPRTIPGVLTINDFKTYSVGMDGTDDEFKLLKYVLDDNIHDLLSKYNYEKTSYKFKFHTQCFKPPTTQEILFEMYPSYWEEQPLFFCRPTHHIKMKTSQH